MNKLENDFLIIETSKAGAELTRIFSKALNKEILWNGDSKYWGRHSPILFPIVGRLKDNETIIDNNVYNMTFYYASKSTWYFFSGVFISI